MGGESPAGVTFAGAAEIEASFRRVLREQNGNGTREKAWRSAGRRFRYTGSNAITPAVLVVPTVTRVVLPQIVGLGRVWALKKVFLGVQDQHIIADPNGSYNIGYTDQVVPTVTGVAAAAATLTATGLAYLTGWRVDFTTALATAGLVTVSNLAGGTETYNLPVGTTSFVQTYGSPVPAPYGSATVNVGAIVGGPGYTINAWGRVLGNGYIDVAGSIFIGPSPGLGQIGGGIPGRASNAAVQDVFEPQCALPFTGRYGGNPDEEGAPEVWAKSGDTVYADVWNAIGGGTGGQSNIVLTVWGIDAPESMLAYERTVR
jgi:hypothetical protein